MSEASAKERIFARLHRAKASGVAPAPKAEKWIPAPLPPEERMKMFTELMEASRAEIIRVSESEWVEALMRRIGEGVRDRKIETLTYGPESDVGVALEAWIAGGGVLPEGLKLVPFASEIEEFKDELFFLDAGLTGAKGAIAESPALILWPSPEEPRTLSLVPPVHFAVVRADQLYTSFPEAIEVLNWETDSPTNALLISGPSKTADIELILQFGVHGPTDLVVLVVE